MIQLHIAIKNIKKLFQFLFSDHLSSFQNEMHSFPNADFASTFIMHCCLPCFSLKMFIEVLLCSTFKVAMVLSKRIVIIDNPGWFFFVKVEADKLKKTYRDDTVEKLADEIRQIKVS